MLTTVCTYPNSTADGYPLVTPDPNFKSASNFVAQHSLPLARQPSYSSEATIDDFLPSSEGVDLDQHRTQIGQPSDRHTQDDCFLDEVSDFNGDCNDVHQHTEQPFKMDRDESEANQLMMKRELEEIDQMDPSVLLDLDEDDEEALGQHHQPVEETKVDRTSVTAATTLESEITNEGSHGTDQIVGQEGEFKHLTQGEHSETVKVSIQPDLLDTLQAAVYIFQEGLNAVRSKQSV